MTPMLGHVSSGGSDLERARAFDDAALAPLGCARESVDVDPDGHELEAVHQ